MKPLLFVLTILFTSSTFAEEGVYVGPQILRTNIKTTGTTVGDAEATDLMVDWQLGYQWPEWYLGATFSSYERALTSGPTTTTTERRTALGVTGGYFNTGFLANLTYFFQAEWRQSATVTYTPGTGIGADLGYRTMISGSFWVSAVLNYKSFTYTRVNVSNVVVEDTNKYTSILPMLGIGAKF